MSTGFKRAIIAIGLLLLGFAWQALGRTPPLELGPIPVFKLTKDGQLDQKFMAERIAFAKQKMAYIEALQPPYSNYPYAFVAAREEGDYPKIKAAIDDELAAHKAIEEAGISAVPGLTGAALVRPPIWLVALAAAVAFQSLAFVMGAAFVGGLLIGMAGSLNTLTGLPAESYLASILATLIIAAAAWWVLQRFWRTPPV